MRIVIFHIKVVVRYFHPENLQQCLSSFIIQVTIVYMQKNFVFCERVNLVVV